MSDFVRQDRVRIAPGAVVGVLIFLLLSGCASTWQPVPVDDAGFLDRAQEVVKDGVRIRAAVPSAKESKTIFSADIYGRGVQPVWLEIENSTAEPVSFMPFGLDADYFTPLETASMHTRRKFADEMDQFFFSSGVNPAIAPGQTRSGFVFTHIDEGTKAFNVDLIGEGRSWHHTFFIQVPGLKIDHYDVDFAGMYSTEQIQDLNEQDLISALQALPCCTTDAKASGSGDPLNIAVIGDPIEVYYAFVRAGWDETEVVKVSSGIKTAMSFITGGEYRYSPVSSLYVFDRAQDVAFQKARSNIHERNHLRLWMTPYRYEGKAVWIGQISRDIGVRFTRKTITTHKVDPDVDETREFLVENLAYHQALAKFGYVTGAIAAPLGEARHNLTGDPYITDGLRVVLWVAAEPVALDDIDVANWEVPES